MATSDEEPRYYANKVARIYLLALEEVLGRNGVGAVLRFAKLGHLVGSYPPDSLDPAFPFGDFAAINQAIQDVYGDRAAKGLCVRAGRLASEYIMRDAEVVPGLSDVALGLLPIGARIKAGLAIMAETFSRLGDQPTYLTEQEDHLAFVIEACPACWGRISDDPVCHAVTGMLEEALRFLSDGQQIGATESGPE
jgi:bacteriochlorophyll 4-vinyl reductase